MAAITSQGERRPSQQSPKDRSDLPTDAEIALAIARSDSLELLSRRELLSVFLELADDTGFDNERWTLTEGGESC